MIYIISLLVVHLCISEPIVTDTIITSDGGSLSIAYTDCKGNGSCDIIIAYKNSVGVVRWSETFGGSSYDKSTSVIEATDGNFYALGATSSFGQGNYDIYVIKINPEGKEIWSKTYGQFYNEYPKHILQKENGTIFIEGTKQICSGTKNNFSKCEYVTWEISINQAGALLSENL